MHRILLRTVCLDLAPDVHDAGLDFWRQALAAETRRATHFPEYHALEHAASITTLYVQELGEGQSHFHIDIDSDDVTAEVARLTGLGAVVVTENRDTAAGDWTVLRDPTGMLFCVVTADVDADFEAKAITVGG